MNNKNIVSVLFATIFFTSLHGHFDSYNDIPANRVFETMQNEFSKRLKETYSTVDRAPFFKRFEEILYGPRRIKTSESFNKEFIHTAVDRVLTEIAIEKMRTMARIYRQSNLLSSEEITNKYKEEIEQACYREPHANVFDTFLSASHMYKTVQIYQDHRHAELMAQEQRDIAQNHANETTRLPERVDRQYSYSFFVSLVDILSNVFYTRESTTQSSSQKKTPSARTTQTECAPRKFHPQVQCPNCLSDFQQESVNSYYLPCGHNLCADCISWAINNDCCPYHNQAPLHLTGTQKADIKAAIENVAGCCTLCSTPKTPANNIFVQLPCNHFICLNCLPVWRALPRDSFAFNGTTRFTDFAKECPRCHQSSTI